jgi:hypothetical protein
MFRPPRRSRAGITAIAFLVILGTSACGASAPTAGTLSAAPSAPASVVVSSAATPLPSGLLASVEQRGGECPAGACDSTVYLDVDGRIHVSAKPPNDVGIATPEQIGALRAAIAATDFGALRRPAFSGQCPTAYDGSELVFTFATTTGAERLASCESALDLSGPLFQALAAALGAAAPFAVAR